jgi:DNA-binding NarL/FixJ family response regulator
VRVVVADDSLLVRAGIVSLLREAGIDVVAQASSAEELLRAVDEHLPEVALVDIRMPPDFSDEGVRAAQELRARHPGIAIVILSQHVDLGTATRVLAESPERLGYLLKRRVTDVEEFVGTIRRVVDGGSALDPVVVSRLLAASRGGGPLEKLTPREHEVLQLIAEGLSNQAIAQRLVVTLRSAEKHVSSIFSKLSLPDTGGEHRRVLAVLQFLHA